MSDKPYFSLAIDQAAKTKLDELTDTFKLTQSEVIEALLETAESDHAILSLQNKIKIKLTKRVEQKEKKKELRKALSKISHSDLVKILEDKGLL